MVQERMADLETLDRNPHERMYLHNRSSKSPSTKIVKSENSGRNSPGSDMTDSVCSNENINIDNSDEDSLPPSPYIINKNPSRNKSVPSEAFKTDKVDSNKLIELQIDNVPSVIVPRTVPCIVLTPPAIFNPGLPLLSFSSVPGRLPHQDYVQESGQVPGLPTTSAFASFPFPSTSNIAKGYCNNGPHDLKTENSVNLSQSCKDELEVEVRNEISSKKLAFGIDRILADEKDASSLNLSMETKLGSGHPVGINLKSYHSHHEDHRGGGGENYASQCSECFFLSRYCRRIQFPTTTPASVSPSSFAWIPPPTSHPSESNSTLLSSNSFGQHLHLSPYGLNNSSFSNMSSMVSCNTNGNGRRKRSWSRAVFSNLQRKGLEKRFQLQKYITKPDRRQLAATLGLTDAQVKVWFQNRRMKWRHSKEGKQGTHIAEDSITVAVEKK